MRKEFSRRIKENEKLIEKKKKNKGILDQRNPQGSI